VIDQASTTTFDVLALLQRIFHTSI